jgi:hypothetical protein
MNLDNFEDYQKALVLAASLGYKDFSPEVDAEYKARYKKTAKQILKEIGVCKWRVGHQPSIKYAYNGGWFSAKLYHEKQRRES